MFLCFLLPLDVLKGRCIGRRVGVEAQRGAARLDAMVFAKVGDEAGHRLHRVHVDALDQGPAASSTGASERPVAQLRCQVRLGRMPVMWRAKPERHTSADRQQYHQMGRRPIDTVSLFPREATLPIRRNWLDLTTL